MPSFKPTEKETKFLSALEMLALTFFQLALEVFKAAFFLPVDMKGASHICGMSLSTFRTLPHQNAYETSDSI